MGTHVKDVDRGYAKLAELLRNTGKGLEVTVGLHAEEGGEPAASGGLTMVEVAELNEFGSPGGLIPARPAITGWADENETKAQGEIGTALRESLAKRTPALQRVEQLAQVYAGQIQQRIAGGIPPENKKSTVDKKGSSTPLVDTGAFRSSILGRVRAK